MRRPPAWNAALQGPPGQQGPWAMDPVRRRSPLSLRLALALAAAGGALVATGQTGVLLRLPRLEGLLLALAVGHLAFAASLLLSQRSWRAARGGLVASLARVYRPGAGGTALFYLLLALAEELLLRVLPLGLWGAGWGTVCGSALVFAALHVWRPGRRGLPLPQLLDLFLFGCVLAALYLAWGDPWTPALAHALRNLAVAKVMVRRDLLAAAGRPAGAVHDARA